MNYSNGGEENLKISIAVREEVKFLMALRELAHIESHFHTHTNYVSLRPYCCLDGPTSMCMASIIASYMHVLQTSTGSG